MVADSLEEALARASEKLSGMGPVVELRERRILVVGDTHGYPEVTRWALSLGDRLGVEAVVFLGDYVDRGPDGVGNLALLAEALVEDRRVYMLRGNHEDPYMNQYYGFADELKAKNLTQLYPAVSSLYQYLPIIAVAKPLFLVHGGIPCRKCSSTREEAWRINEIAGELGKVWGTRKSLDTYYGNKVLRHLLWNDPSIEVEWYSESPRGPGIYYYGPAAWGMFLKENNLKAIVRAHEKVDAALAACDTSIRPLSGTLSLEDIAGCVLTVFSSLYHGEGAGALEFILDEGRIHAYRYGG
ncbi:MAG: hypothetical protein DSY37_02275 [Hyperthermus sp.]|nr:MAG: hypothetical protein DSY37_02275 [Hyperthermus sp.]